MTAALTNIPISFYTFFAIATIINNITTSLIVMIHNQNYCSIHFTCIKIYKGPLLC